MSLLDDIATSPPHWSSPPAAVLTSPGWRESWTDWPRQWHLYWCWAAIIEGVRAWRQEPAWSQCRIAEELLDGCDCPGLPFDFGKPAPGRCHDTQDLAHELGGVASVSITAVRKPDVKVAILQKYLEEDRKLALARFIRGNKKHYVALLALEPNSGDYYLKIADPQHELKPGSDRAKHVGRLCFVEGNAPDRPTEWDGQTMDLVYLVEAQP